MRSGKRKRLCKWAAVAGGALLLVAVLLYAFSLSPPSEYEFLDGRTLTGLEVSDGSTAGPTVMAYYVFQAEFEDLVGRAKNEIVTDAGGQESSWRSGSDPPDYVGFYDAADRLIRVLRGRPDFNQIPTLLVGQEDGWVTVTIFEVRKPTLSERLRIWLQDRGL